MQDPEIYLAQLGVRLACPVDTARDAALDSRLRVWVGHEVFFFSTADARARFEADPNRYYTVLTDPVTGRRFRPDHASPREVHDGRLYVFADSASRAEFTRAPRRHSVPMAAMLDMRR